MSLTTGSLTVMAPGLPVVRLVTFRFISRSSAASAAVCAPAAVSAASAVDLPVSAAASSAAVCVSTSAASAADAGETRVAAMTKAMPPNKAFFKLISLFLIDLLLCSK